jgi:hypothetical protein
MPTDFRVFRERLAHACRVRNMTHDRLCRSIGLGGRPVIDLEFSGLKALDIERLSQIADRLNVFRGLASGPFRPDGIVVMSIVPSVSAVIEGQFRMLRNHAVQS